MADDVLTETLLDALTADQRGIYQISQESGIAYAQLHRFQAGKRTLSLHTAGRLADALGLRLRPGKNNSRKSDCVT